MEADGNVALNGRSEAAVAPQAARSVTRRAVLAGAALASAMLLVAVPVKLCAFAVLFGAPCPGCGMTRALLCLLTGDLERALALHPLAPLVVPWVSIAALRHAIAFVRTGDAWRLSVPRDIERFAAAVTLLLLIALWGARFFGYFGGPVPV